MLKEESALEDYIRSSNSIIYKQHQLQQTSNQEREAKITNTTEERHKVQLIHLDIVALHILGLRVYMYWQNVPGERSGESSQ